MVSGAANAGIESSPDSTKMSDIQEQFDKLHDCKRGLNVATSRDYYNWWRTMEKLLNALEFYGDPTTYHACGFDFDRPCGAFEDDFSESDIYDYPKPGKLAREILGYEPEWFAPPAQTRQEPACPVCQSREYPHICNDVLDVLKSISADSRQNCPICGDGYKNFNKLCSDDWHDSDDLVTSDSRRNPDDFEKAALKHLFGIDVTAGEGQSDGE